MQGVFFSSSSNRRFPQKLVVFVSIMARPGSNDPGRSSSRPQQPELAAPVRDKADDCRCLRRCCRRTSITPPPVLARQVSRLHAAASCPSHPSPDPDRPSRCPSPLQQILTSPSLPTPPSVAAPTPPSAHIACMHRPTASLVCHHVAASSFTSAARWHVGMGVASPQHPTATTDVECVEDAAAATVPAPLQYADHCL
ncbi:hypothetical protein ACLOJK_040139 [Asimina triloba]